MTANQVSGPLIATVLTGLVVATATSLYYTANQPPAAVTCNVVGNADVTDLIARLRPFVKDADGRWYSNGLEIRFSANDVRMSLEMKNGNKFLSEARTLREAVERLTMPSAILVKALSGWGEVKP